MDAVTASPAPPNVVVRVSDLHKRYGEVRAVDGLAFDVYQGEVFGFLGPNGAGKTTTIHMICGLIEPTSGEIRILGLDPRAKAAAKGHIGICLQENIHWPKLTCLEQLTFMGEMYGMPHSAANARSRDLLRWMGLQEKAGTRAEHLSGGMKRRLNICLALVHDPEILIMDEPEVGLDPQSRLLVREFIKTLARDKTVILTTHNMDEAERLADRVAIIDYGRLLLLDTPENLKRSVGEGDVVEIALENPLPEQMASAADALAATCQRVSISGATLIIQSRDVIGTLAGITNTLTGHGLKINATTLRENTLEDVFIHLTGRKLRQ
jgi:ABC-2 type transport system ATP-binding protein